MTLGFEQSVIRFITIDNTLVFTTAKVIFFKSFSQFQFDLFTFACGNDSPNRHERIRTAKMMNIVIWFEYASRPDTFLI